MNPAIKYSPLTWDFGTFYTDKPTNHELYGAVVGALVAGGIGALAFDHQRFLGGIAMALPGAVAGYVVGHHIVRETGSGVISLPPPAPSGQCLSTDEQKQAAMLACMKAANCLTTEEYRKLEASNGQPLPELLGKPCFFSCMEGVEAKACPGN